MGFLKRLFGKGTSQAAAEGGVVENLLVTNLANKILTDAVARNASEIHLEPGADEPGSARQNEVDDLIRELPTPPPEGKEYAVRYRVFGALQTATILPANLQAEVFAEIKSMAGLNPSRTDVPQDGRITMQVPREGKAAEMIFLVATLPAPEGEKIAIQVFG